MFSVTYKCRYRAGCVTVRGSTLYEEGMVTVVDGGKVVRHYGSFYEVFGECT